MSPPKTYGPLGIVVWGCVKGSSILGNARGLETHDLGDLGFRAQA